MRDSGGLDLRCSEKGSDSVYILSQRNLHMDSILSVKERTKDKSKIQWEKILKIPSDFQ